MWDPPPTASVLGSLSYQLSVLKMNTGQVIVNTTTTDTSYPLPTDRIQPCQENMANVTASALYQHSHIAITVQRSPGGESYRV